MSTKIRRMIWLCLPLFFSCQPEKNLKRDLAKLIETWDYVLPLPSDNDSINLLFIQSEMNWYRYQNHISDSLCDRILAIDSTFHHAIAFKAWEPLNLAMLNKAMQYAKNCTTIHKTVFEADIAYWIQRDTATAIQKFKEVYDKYPNSKTACWCLGMSYLWAGQYDKAITYYQKALEIDNDFPRSNEMMGWAYYKKHDYANSIKNFEIAINGGTKDFRAFRFTGEGYEKLGQLDKANHFYSLADSLKNISH